MTDVDPSSSSKEGEGSKDGNGYASIAESYDPQMASMTIGNAEQQVKHPEAPLKIRLLIHTLQVGAVIGRSGERIKNLRKNYNAVIEVVSDAENQIPERTITISATEKNLIGVMREMIPFLNENQPPSLRHSLHSYGAGAFSARILVHYVIAGSVIGTGGANIRQLRQKSGAQVTVYHDCCPQSSDRVIMAVGSLEGVLVAMGAVMDTIAETDVRGQTYPYNPFQSYDPRAVGAYGGFAMLDPYGQEVTTYYGQGRYYEQAPYPVPPGMGMPPPLPRMPFPGGERAGTKRRRSAPVTGAPSNAEVKPLAPAAPIPPLVELPGDLSSYYTGGYYLPTTSGERPSKISRPEGEAQASGISGDGLLPPSLLPTASFATIEGQPRHYPPPPNGLEQPLPPLSAAAPSLDQPRSDQADPPPLLPQVPPLLLPAPPPPVQSTEQYTIPPEAAGAVIGPRGKRAHFVRQTTGCRVTISDDLTKSGNRVVTLTGTKFQVDAAKHHMRTFLAEFYQSQRQGQLQGRLPAPSSGQPGPDEGQPSSQ